MSEKRLEELDHLIGKWMLRVLPLLKTCNEIDSIVFNELFIYLEDLRIEIKGEKTISRSLAFKLFHLYYTCEKGFRSYPQTKKEEANSLQSDLTMFIAAIFSDAHFR